MGGKAVEIAQVSRGQVGGTVGHFCCLDNSWFLSWSITVTD